MKKILFLCILIGVLFGQATSLENQTIGHPDSTFKQLLRFENNAASQITLKQIFDGTGDSTALWLSHDSVKVGGNLAATTLVISDSAFIDTLKFNILYGGIIKTGTWTGSSIADAYIDDDITASNYILLTTDRDSHIVHLAYEVTGNTETLITVTAQGDGTLDFIVNNDLHSYSWTNVVDGDIPDALTITPINATTETAIETVVDLQDLQGAVTDGQVPDNITITESDPVWISDSTDYRLKSTPLAGEVSGAYESLVIGNDVLDDQYFDAQADIDHDQTTNFTQGEHFTEASISITESQISNLDHFQTTDETDQVWISDSTDYRLKTTHLAGEVSGAYGSLIIGNDVLDDQYFDAHGDVDHDQTTNYIAKLHFYQEAIDSVNTGLTGVLRSDSGVLSIDTDVSDLVTETDPVWISDSTDYRLKSTPLAGEVSGAYGSLVIGNDVLDDQYYDSEGDLTTLLDDNYVLVTADRDSHVVHLAYEVIGNTETGIAVTAPGDGTLDFVVDHDAANNFVSQEHIRWDLTGTGTVHTNNYIENVPTALSIGTTTTTTVAITSDSGADDVIIPAAINGTAGLLTDAKWDEIVANSSKNTNVSTSLTLDTPTSTTVLINSDGSSPDITLIEATTTTAGLLGAAKWNEIVASTSHSGLTNNPHSVDAADVSLGNVTNVATSDVAYDAGTWDGNTDNATKNAIRDKIEGLPGGHDAVTLNANATAAGLSLSTQEINYRAATNAQTGYMTAAFVQNIETNNAKNTNVSTELSEGTRAPTTYAITSDGGADDIVLPEANTTNAGLLGADKWDEIVASTNHISADGSSHTFIDQSVISGATPTLSATNFSDGGSNAIITTTQETNFEAAYSHVSNSGTDHSLLGATPGTATASKALIVDSNKDINLGTGDLTATNVTGTLQTAAQTNITSVGILTALQIDNININGNTISSTAGTDLLITPLAGQDIILDGHWQFDGADLTAITNNNTIINAYSGKNITIESIVFDGGKAGFETSSPDNLITLGSTLLGAASGNAVSIQHSTYAQIQLGYNSGNRTVLNWNADNSINGFFSIGTVTTSGGANWDTFTILDGNIGVKTSEPSEILVVGDDIGEISAGNTIALADDSGNTISFSMAYNSANRGIMNWVGGADGYFTWGTLTTSGGSNWDALTLRDGKLGVKRTNPASTLEVNGGVNIGGTDAIGDNDLSVAGKVSTGGGLHVGGDSDAGDNNLLVDGTAIIAGTLTHGSPSFSVFQADTSQSGILDAQYIKVRWDFKDSGADWNDSGFAIGAGGSGGATNSRWTPGVQGIYQFNAHIWLDAGDHIDEQLYVIILFINGVKKHEASMKYSGTGNFQSPTLSTAVFMDSNDYAELFIWQASGNTQRTISSSEVSPISNYTWWQGYKVQ